MKNCFGINLKNARKLSGKTQHELATFCALSKQYISDIENGKNKPPNESILQKIFMFLQLDKKQKTALLDAAASQREDIPSDIKKIIFNHPEIIQQLRERYENE